MAKVTRTPKKASTEKKVAKKTCSQCKRLPVKGKTRCRKHLAEAIESTHHRNEERKHYKICRRCPNFSIENHVLCKQCLEKQLAVSKCRWCDKPPKTGRSLCEDHLKIDRDKVRTYRAKRKAKGLCWRCPRKARPGGSLCDYHRKLVTTQERELEEAKKAKANKTS